MKVDTTRTSRHCYSRSSVSLDSKMHIMLDVFESFLPRSDRRLVRMLLTMATFFIIMNLVQFWHFSILTVEMSQGTLTRAGSTRWMPQSQGGYPGLRTNATSTDGSDGWSDHVDTSQANFNYLLRQDGRENDFCSRDNRIVNENMPSSSDNQHPIFLWGIPSTVAEKDVERRQLLRSTYLNFFRDFEPLHAGNNSRYERDRICSLQEWTCRYHELRSKCQLIYVFFIGGGDHETASPYILDESLIDFRQMLIPPHPIAVPHSDTPSTMGPIEPGVAYLNIRENQFDGKMTTWFQFSALVGREYPEIDYAAKVDSDLLLLTPNFFDYIEKQHQSIVGRRQRTTPRKDLSSQQQQQHESTTITRVYGGVEFPDTNCELNNTFDHPCPLPLVGRSYMSGELNFMSMDLARYIASDDCPRERVTIPHEDVSLSNYVYSYTSNHAYHKRIQNGNARYGTIREGEDTTIDIISVNTTQILLTTTTLADWHNINFNNQPELFQRILWGHSIKRGNYKRYLVWKEDRSFQHFWDRFMIAYAKLVGGTSPAVLAAQKKKKISVLQKSAVRRGTFLGLNSTLNG
jgi:hypothetical protein